MSDGSRPTSGYESIQQHNIAAEYLDHKIL